MRDSLTGGGLRLSAPVGRGAPNRPKDVFQVETVLHGADLLPRTPGTRFGEDTATAIGNGQQRLNRDHIAVVGRKPLKVDGLINPEGPTQTATRGLAKQVADQWRGFEARNQAKPAKPVSAARPPVAVKSDSSLDADIKRLRDNMTADDAGELHRLADGLSKTSSPGKAAADISRAIDKDGLKAITEFQAVRERLAEKGTPEQVRALDRAVIGGVTENQRVQLSELIQSLVQFDGPEYRMNAHNRLRDTGEKIRTERREKDMAERDVLNQPLPLSSQQALDQGFKLLPEELSMLHQNDRGKPELKFIHKDGREIIFDGDSGEIITDPRIKGTYNYEPAPISWGHLTKDLIPFYMLQSPERELGESEIQKKSWTRRGRKKGKSIRAKWKL